VQPLLQWKSSTIRVCLCIPRYPAWLAHAPYRHLWPVQLYNIFPYYLINGKIFEKKKKELRNINFVFLFCQQLLSSRSKKNLSSCKVPIILVRSY